MEGIEKIGEKVWKFQKGPGLNCFIYFVDYGVPTLIDLGMKKYSPLLLKRLKSLGYDPEDIKRVIFTHLHYDHVGKPSDFSNAKFFASKEAIEDYKKLKYFSVFDMGSIKELNNIKLNVLKKVEPFEVIKTPGHTRGSICLWLEKDKILFSGDTLFHRGTLGRTDLPDSVPKEMDNSIKKLEKIKYKVLCPGH